MAKENGNKRHIIDPSVGVKSQFTSENQPPAESKINGWEAKRARRLLTQMIIDKLTQGNKLEEYVDSLILNATNGNPKAIDTINNGLEDQITKTDITSNGNEIPAQIVIVNSVPEMKELEG